MLYSIKGYFEDGKIVMEEQPPVNSRTNVIITFLAEDIKPHSGKRIPGGLTGKVIIPDDFDEPLDDLKDYM